MAAGFLLKIAGSLLAGGLLGVVLPAPSLHVAVLFGLFFMLTVAAYFQKMFEHAVWLFLLLSAALFGLFLTCQSLEIEKDLYVRQYGPVDGMSVRVLSDPYLERKSVVELVAPPYTGKRMIMKLDGLAKVPAFRQTVKIEGTANGIFLVPSGWVPFQGLIPALTPIEQFHFLALKIRDRIDLSLLEAKPPPRFLAFARAELFGKRADLDPATLRVLQENGLTHIIAVSGMHTSLLAAAVFFLLSGMLGREAAAGVTLLSVGIFCVMVGMQPSVIRASIATALTLLGAIQKRPVRLLNILAACFIAEFLLFSDHLRNIGFQLSYLAVLAIALVNDLWRTGQFRTERRMANPNLRMEGLINGDRRIKYPAWVKTILPLLLIQVFTAPLTAYLFYRWSILSVFSNLIFLPVFTFLIGLAAAGAGISLFWHTMAAWLFWSGDAILSVTLKVLGQLPEFLSLSANFGEIPLWFFLAFTTSWILFLFLVPRNPRYWLLGSCGFLLLLCLFPVVKNSFSPMCVFIGGDQTPYVVLKEGGRVRYASIGLNRGRPLDALRPLFRQLLRVGVKRIDRLDASQEIRDALGREFILGDLEGEHVKRLGRGGFHMRHGGLEILYLTDRMDGYKPDPGILRRVMVVESDGRQRLSIPNGFKPDQIYITGEIPQDLLRTLIMDLDGKGGTNVMAAAVDGQLTLWKDRYGLWQSTTALLESME